MSVLEQVRKSFYGSSTQPKGQNTTHMRQIKDHFANIKVEQMQYYSTINLNKQLKHKFFGFPPQQHFDIRKEEKLVLFNYPGKGKMLITENQLDKMTGYNDRDDLNSDLLKNLEMNQQ